MNKKLLAAMLCGVSISSVSWQAEAQTQGHTHALTQQFNISAGNLEQALDQYRQQTTIQLIYRPQEVAKARSAGVSGVLSREAGLNAILAGSGFKQHRNDSGAIAIVSSRTAATAASFQRIALSEQGPVVPAAAAQAAPEPVDDILVTARRRDEASIAVPVMLTAVSGAELQRRAINDMDSLARLVPGLTIAGAGGSTQGGTVVLRGVAGPDTNPLGDQAVSFNIDGVQVAKSSIRRLAFMDLQQVEVLKGPQALFFGKNSPGGIISVRSADPTPHLAAKASLGYEFKAHEWRGEGFISGPLTDTLGARLAFYGSHMRGWVKSLVPENSLFPPFHRYGPRSREFDVRGTLKFDPTDRFSARLKLSYGKTKGAGQAENSQVVACPLGISQLQGIVSDCKANNRNNRTDNVGTVFTPYEPGFRNGETYAEQEQILAGLELNYALTDTIDLTSVTGFYRSNYKGAEHFSRYPVQPILMFGFSLGLPQILTYLPFRNREISQEFRANSHFDGPLNFTIGGIITDTRSSIGSHFFINATNPVEIRQFSLTQNGTAYSVFGQARYDVTPQLELSAGGRYSYERKTLPVTLFDFTSSRTAPMVPYQTPVDRVSFNDFSPELTINYRPTDQLTLFASYKRGFLSGGFNGAVANPAIALNYGPQKIRGFEGGVKARLFGGALRTNLSLYNYEVPGLQITAFEQPPGGGAQVGTIRNAGGARTKGIEFDMTYRTPIEGLSLSGALSYNHARFTEYFGPCWTGQSQGQGCNFLALGGGLARPIRSAEIGNVQDLAGRQLINAPEWAGSIGANYETSLGSRLSLGLSGEVNFASSVPTDATLNPLLISRDRWLFDAAVQVGDAEDRWEVALIGRNLTNDFYWSGGQELAFTGSRPTGGPTPGVPADAYAVLNRGREIMLRLTVALGQ
ncbi:TonB-dependent receptor [Rhizorhabdus argentea]|uniref:TonB-dependent receptor n=1 Tax=Rhizorhabdus argentea TaxID=1387174 RepID=UPI0030EB3B21